MEALRNRRPATALLLAGLLLGALGGLTACTGENVPESLPSNRPSAERTADRTTEPTPTEPTPTQDETTKTSRPEPTRTRTQDPEPTKTQEPEPTKTKTQDPEPEPTKTQEPEPTTAATSSSAVVAAPVADQDDSGLGPWAWLLLIGLLTALVALLLTNRSRKLAAWDSQAHGLSGETRTILGVRLPPILTTTNPSQRGLAWPPIRDDLTSLEARWAALLETAPDGERQAYASQVTGILRDLVNAIDAENEALTTGRDWRMLRPRLDAILAALTAALDPSPPPPAARPAPAPQQGYGPASQPGYAADPQPGYSSAPDPEYADPADPATSIYGEPLDEEPSDNYPPPRHASPGNTPPRPHPGYPNSQPPRPNPPTPDDPDGYGPPAPGY